MINKFPKSDYFSIKNTIFVIATTDHTGEREQWGDVWSEREHREMGDELARLRKKYPRQQFSVFKISNTYEFDLLIN